MLEKAIPQAKAQGKARKEEKRKGVSVVPKVLQTKLSPSSEGSTRPGKTKAGNSATVAATVAAVLPTTASGHSFCQAASLRSRLVLVVPFL